MFEAEVKEKRKSAAIEDMVASEGEKLVERQKKKEEKKQKIETVKAKTQK